MTIKARASSSGMRSPSFTGTTEAARFAASFEPMAARISRLRSLDPRIVDRLLVAFMSLYFLGEAISYGDWSSPLMAFDLLVGFGLMASLLVRRSRPVVPAAAVVLLFGLAGALDPEFFYDVGASFVAMFVTLYSLGRYEPGRRGVAVAGVVMASVIAFTALIDNQATTSGQLLWFLVLGLGPFLVGRAMADRTRLQRELIERTEELERDREKEAERAVIDERARIAGELQAVIANGVSAMVLGAEAVPRLISSGERDRAERTLLTVEETGRDSLAEMRRLLGVLRRDDDSPSLAPLPTLDQVEHLATQIREGGMEVGLELTGERIALPPGADLAAYRILEEALEQAVDGGARSADVLIGYEPDELRLDVSDDRAAGTLDPEPLMAMRERLGLYGGRVRAEAGAGGRGFHVAARLPLNGALL